MSIDIKPLAVSERNACPKEFSFGEVFADHMFTQSYEADKNGQMRKLSLINHCN